MKNSFDDKIKEALESFEMPYDTNAWAELEQKLPNSPVVGSPSAGASSSWKIVALVAVAAVATSIWYYSNKTDVKTDNTEQVAVELQKTDKIEAAPTAKKATESRATEETATREISSEINATSSKQDEQTAEGFADVDEEIMRSSEKEESFEVAEQINMDEPDENAPTESAQSASDESSISVDFIASTITACVNQEVSFINESKAKSAKMIWDFGDGYTSSDKDPVHSFVAPGVYTVSLLATTKSDQAEKTVDIKVNPAPTPTFSAERKLNGYQAIPLYTFSTTTQSNENATWSFSDGSRVAGTDATRLFRNAGTHTAKLTITNKFGCSTMMDEEFVTRKFNLLAPTAFTPGGDGINETFMPKALPVMGIAFEMTIQDPKTGQVVYRTEDASAPWNGTLNNSGVELEKGLYVWTVVLKDNVVENRVFTEAIQLTR